GTTWTQEIVWLIHNNGDIEAAKKTPLFMRFPFMDFKQEFNAIKTMSSPRLIKTHLNYPAFSAMYDSNQTDRPKIIYVVRNPKDVAVSYYNFYKMNTSLGSFTGPFSEFLSMFMEGYVCIGDYFKNVLGWYEASTKDDHILLIKYEDLKKSPLEQIKQIAGFLEKDLGDDVLKAICDHVSFANMKANPMVNYEGFPIMNHDISPFMRKGEIGDWKNYFTTEEDAAFMKLYREKMKDRSLTFDFE
ncbi:unnamed protein product, partial [Owenia fusiformis]